MFEVHKASGETAVSTSWLAWPTLRSGGGQIKTAGVQYHAEALRRTQEAVGSMVTAELRIEPAGQYAGAVRVFVAGEMLGSIPHDLADKFRAVITELAVSDLPATCRVQLDIGEWLDVWLDARPQRRDPNDPFLPPLSSSTVHLYPEEAERIEEGLHSNAKSKRVVVLGELSAVGSSWQLAIEGRPVGKLEDGAYSALEEARDGGFPLTCQVRILRVQGKALRVMADLPRDEQ
jgi:hypothetical protein